MDWQGGPVSDNVEDRRGGGGDGGGMISGIGGGGGLGIGAIIVLTLIGWATGINPQLLIGGAQVLTGSGNSSSYNQSQSSSGKTGVPNDQMGKFIASVLGETEGVWTKILPEQTKVQYTKPKLVLFDGQTRSGCGTAQSAMGPFYCPEDQKVYLDMSFFKEMQQSYGGGGEFAYAYVVAHEVGHHVENLLGILPKIQQLQDNASSKTQSNALSVRVELLADCFAGVWAANANQQYKILQQGDVEQAVATAQAIGDDKLQTKARGYAVPDSFTHGSAADRTKWLSIGLQSGQINSCAPLLSGL